MNALRRFAARPLGALILSLTIGTLLYLALVAVTGCVDYRSCQ